MRERERERERERSITNNIKIYNKIYIGNLKITQINNNSFKKELWDNKIIKWKNNNDIIIMIFKLVI